MEPKTVLITGATDGIGLQTARELSVMGFQVIVHGRTLEKARHIAGEISKLTGAAQTKIAVADFSSLAQVKKMAEELKSKYQKLEILINNAGVFENDYRESEDGFELTFAVNHLAHFVLTLHLLPLLKATKNGRIINVASMAHSSSIDLDHLNSEKHFSGYGAYGDSKLCNILFTNYLSKKLKGNPTVNSLHPGVITTKLLQAGFGMGGGSLEEGAKTSVYLAVSDEVEGVSGKYFANSAEREPAGISYDEKLQQKLWEKSIDWTGAFLPTPMPV